MNWNSPAADDERMVRLGSRSDSTLAVASRYSKLAPVAWAALRMAPVTGLEPTGVLASTAMVCSKGLGAAACGRCRTLTIMVNGALTHGRRSPMTEATAVRHKRGGLYFDDFVVGHLYEHPLTRTVTQMDNMLFSNMTLNPQPLHIDRHFCEQETEWGKPLMNSLFTLGLMIGISVNDLTVGTTIANLGMTEVKFPHPLFEGDTVHCTTEVLGKRESNSRPGAGIVEFYHRAYNQDGKLVAECHRQAFMRMRPRSSRPHAHERLAVTFGDELAVLIVGAVIELDDAGSGPGVRFPLAQHFGGAMDGVALEQRMRELDLGHAQIGDRGPHREVVDRDADHQPEREQRVHQRLAPFGLLLAEMPVDVQRLRVERHVGEQHVVRLRHRAGEAMLEGLAERKILEIEPAAGMAGGGERGVFHGFPPGSRLGRVSITRRIAKANPSRHLHFRT